MQLHSVHPTLNLVVQDTRSMIQQARSAWEAKYPSALVEGKVNIEAHDFSRRTRSSVLKYTGCAISCKE
jgi:hypothetical protein